MLRNNFTLTSKKNMLKMKVIIKWSFLSIFRLESIEKKIMDIMDKRMKESTEVSAFKFGK